MRKLAVLIGFALVTVACGGTSGEESTTTHGPTTTLSSTTSASPETPTPLSNSFSRASGVP
jgi:ABC-type glycerol-3-phosphate transport system substrate-binding protein